MRDLLLEPAWQEERQRFVRQLLHLDKVSPGSLIGGVGALDIDRGVNGESPGRRRQPLAKVAKWVSELNRTNNGVQDILLPCDPLLPPAAWPQHEQKWSRNRIMKVKEAGCAYPHGRLISSDTDALASEKIQEQSKRVR